MKRCLGNRPNFGQKTTSAKSASWLAGWLVVTIVLLMQARPAHAVVHSSMVVNAETGQVLHSYHPDARAHPASLTKLMTLYLTFQRLADGHLTLNQRLQVSRLAAAQQPSKLGLRAGTTVSVRTCILGIISHSANDAAVVLAENIAGSEPRFAHMMNQEARLLGMTHTEFYNANGLPNRRQWTTARDMATLALSLIQTYPQYYHYFGVHEFRYHGRTFHTYDHLAEVYPGADGMKTGYIYSSGFNIVTSAVRDHHRLIGVFFGGHTARARDREMAALLNRGFRSFAHSDQLVASGKVPPTPVRSNSANRRPVQRRVRKAAVARRAADPAPSGGRDTVIQVGYNFRSLVQARRVLHSARLSAPSLRHHGRALVVRLRSRRYRARFADLSQERAFHACSDLREKRYTCTIVAGAPGRQRDIAEIEHRSLGRR